MLPALMDVLAAAAAEVPDNPVIAQRLTEEARWTCIVLRKQQWKQTAIAEYLGCSRNTVRTVLAVVMLACCCISLLL